MFSEVLRQLVWFAGLGFIAGFIWLLGRWKNRDRRALPADRPDFPYSVYTAEFDVVSPARDVAKHLSPTGHIASGMEIVDHGDRIAAAEEIDNRLRAEGAGKALVECLSGRSAASAVVVLVDQSGSMRDRIVQIAGQVPLLAEEFERTKVAFALLGFTTRSWRGGIPREKWDAAGRPPYPGRLCPLLHIVYRDFERSLERSDWEAMLDPYALRENIDGEALLWAAEMPLARPEYDKRLILLSDGAPVDDSTIAANGDRFLPRHLETVAAQIQEAAGLKVGTVSIGYENAIWKVRTTISDPAEFLPAFVEIMRRLDAAG